MTIKKPMKTAASAGPAAAPAAGGGATIANRLKLDLTEPVKKPAASSTATTVAAYAGIAAFIVAGILTYMLYKHWEFLMPA